MKQPDAIALAAHINEEEKPHITALVERTNRGSWRVRATFRPMTPDAVSLTAATVAEWEGIRNMWAMLPVDLGEVA